jgi:N-acetylneuraminic acid mutarotase
MTSALFKVVTLALIIIANTACNDFTKSPYPTISFQPISSMPDKGRASAVAWSIDGKGYVALGRTKDKSIIKTSTRKQLNDCWSYDPKSNKWTRMADFPDTPRVKAIAAVVNEKAYVGLGYNLEKNFSTDGGNNNPANLRHFWSYDPSTNKWTRMADFPSSASNACVSAVINDEIFVVSGFDGIFFTKEIWSYNCTTNTWREHKKGEYWGPRSNPIFLASKNHIYLGTGYRGNTYNDWWQYFPENETWIRRKKMPDEGRTSGLGFTINERFFVATGRHPGGDMTGGKLFNDVIEYNPDKDEWYERGFIPDGGRENAVCFIINDTAYIGCGENSVLNDEECVLNNFWKFKP